MPRLLEYASILVSAVVASVATTVTIDNRYVHQDDYDIYKKELRAYLTKNNKDINKSVNNVRLECLDYVMYQYKVKPRSKLDDAILQHYSAIKSENRLMSKNDTFENFSFVSPNVDIQFEKPDSLKNLDAINLNLDNLLQSINK